MKKNPIFVSLILIGSVLAGTVHGERVVVPLTYPDRPVTVEASLTSGGIEVEVHDGVDVVVDVAVRESEISGGEEPGRDGLRRLPNSGLDFSVEEESNVVVIVSESWKRTIDVKLKVPVNTSLHVQTVHHGEIKVFGVRGDHELGNTNGPIEALDVSGSVVAHTTNGIVRVVLVDVEEGAPMAFSTLNGDVDVTLPADLAAEFHMRSDNGEILTDFEVELMASSPEIERESDGGRFRFEMRNETRGAVNGGGPEMSFRTFNGDVVIRKAQ